MPLSEISLPQLRPQLRPWLAAAILLLLWLWESWSPYFPFSRGKLRFRHGGRNLLFGVGNGLITAFGFVGLWWLAADWSQRHQFGLLYQIPLPGWTECTIAILLLDVWMYCWHRLNHLIPFLWRFHRLHHSDREMDVTTANRFHTGEIVMSALLRIPLIAGLGISMGQLALYETLMFAVVQFHHANVALPPRVDRLLRGFIVTPFMHKVHHSRWQPETDSNYSSLLSVWDRLFRSLRHHPNPSELRLGLDEFDAPHDQVLGGMLTTPLRDVRKPSLK